MKLYLIHCGYYDEEIADGIYEFHVNLPIVALNVDEAKKVVRLNPIFKEKKMHIDGIQEINVIAGYRIDPILISTESCDQVVSYEYRDF